MQGAEVVFETKTASWILTFWIYPVFARNIAFALVFIQRRTILITYATVVRLLALFVFLFIFPFRVILYTAENSGLERNHGTNF